MQTWTTDRKQAFHTVDETGFQEIEPGLRASRPVVRLTPADRRCVHGYYTMSPLSADGALITYYAFDDPHPNRNSGRPLTGRVIVASADGSDARPIADLDNASVAQGVMQQWVGPGHRVGFVHYGSREKNTGQGWTVIDLDTDECWEGEGQAREFAPEGRDLFIQTPEQVHLWAEKEGRILAPEEVAASIIDYTTGEEKVRISVADVLAIHPDASRAQHQHMCFKQTLFGPNGQRIAFNFSNAFYTGHHPEEPRRHEKFVALRDGTEIQYLGDGAGHPCWHPDSEHYFALVPDCEGITRFMLYPLDGTPPRALGLDWLGAGHPSFQPGEGRYLAVDIPVRDRGHVFLRLYDLQEESYEDVLVADYTDYSNDSGTHFHPAWTPDGRSLYIASAHGECAGVYRIDLV